MADAAECGAVGVLGGQDEVAVVAVRAAFQDQRHAIGRRSLRGRVAAFAGLRRCSPSRPGAALNRGGRLSQHQAAADQPGIDPDAAREAVAPMVVDQVADADTEPRAAVPFAGFHPPATDRHTEPPSRLARESMRDQVDVPVAARGLHFGRPFHNPPVLHRIGPEPLPEPHAVVGPLPPVDSRGGVRAGPVLLSGGSPPDPLRQRDNCRQQPEEAPPAQPVLR